MRKYLLDTDVLINFLRGKEKAREFLSSMIDDSVFLCSAITVAEIYAGMRDHEEKMTAELIDSLDVIGVTREIAETAGTLKRKTKGHSLELDDCIIAATAIARGAVLATGNIKHYAIDSIEKIRVAG